MNLSLPKLWRASTNAALSLFYPEVCQLCGLERAAHNQSYVCASCREAVQFIERPFCEKCGRPYPGAITNTFECGACQESAGDLHFCRARSAAAAEGPVLEAIHLYKYSRQLWLEGFLADLLVKASRTELVAQKWDALVPVPLFPVKEREREFNQAERLARRLSAASGIPVQRRVLKRVVATRTQTRLSKKERADNMRGAFALRKKEKLTGRRFVLIDDVFTTGATANACAKVLMNAGAQEVAVWTVARGI